MVAKRGTVVAFGLVSCRRVSKVPRGEGSKKNLIRIKKNLEPEDQKTIK